MNGTMKKILIRVVLVVVVLLVVAGLAISLTIDKAIKKGVETIGPRLTKVDVTLDGVSLSILSGSGALKGLVIGNPMGYKTGEAMSVGLASVSVSPGSVFSEKVVVRSIRIEAPKVTFELGPGGNNLQTIQKNLEAATGSSGGAAPVEEEPQAEAAGAGKKLQVDEVLVTGGTVTLGAAALGGKVIEAPLPEIRLNDLGQGPEGITAAELGKVLLSKITEEAIKTYGDQLAEAGAKALEDLSGKATNSLNQATSDALNKATKGLDSLLNKKKE